MSLQIQLVCISFDIDILIKEYIPDFEIAEAVVRRCSSK